MAYTLTRTLPNGQVKASLDTYASKSQAAMRCARLFSNDTGASPKQMYVVHTALMDAEPGQTVGPFGGQSFRIDQA